MSRSCILIVLVLLLLTSCSNTSNNTNNELGTSTESPDDEYLNRIITAINENDAVMLHQCLDKASQEILSVEMVKCSIDDFKMFFHNELIVKYEMNSEYADLINSVNFKEYTLVTDKGRKKSILIGLDRNQYFLSHLFLQYSFYKNYKIKYFIEAIQDRNAELLARNIYQSEDGEIYPINEAEKIIKKYEDYFDLATLSWEFTGEIENSSFICNIIGTKDGSSVNHKIILVCGDGQVGIKDDWITDYYELE